MTHDLNFKISSQISKNTDSNNSVVLFGGENHEPTSQYGTKTFKSLLLRLSRMQFCGLCVKNSLLCQLNFQTLQSLSSFF